MKQQKKGKIKIRQIGEGGEGVEKIKDGKIYVNLKIKGEVVNVEREKKREKMMEMMEEQKERKKKE